MTSANADGMDEKFGCADPAILIPGTTETNRFESVRESVES